MLKNPQSGSVEEWGPFGGRVSHKDLNPFKGDFKERVCFVLLFTSLPSEDLFYSAPLLILSCEDAATGARLKTE